MKACGWDGKSISTMCGKEVEIVVRHETYENRTRARVAFVNETRDLNTKERMHDDEKAEVQSKLASFAQGLGIVEPDDAGDHGVTEADDDLPFRRIEA